MVAVTRFVQFDPDADTSMTMDTNQTVSGTGSPGYAESNSAAPSTVTITSSVDDQIEVEIDSSGNQVIVTLSSGTGLDARVVARDITYQLKAEALTYSELEHVMCEYINNKFRITSSSLGTTSNVSITHPGGRSCLHLLGWAASKGGALTLTTQAGQATSNNGAYTGQPSVGGTYKGQFDDIYTVMIGKDHPVQDPTVSGLYAGTAESAGDWNEASDAEYTVLVSTTNGSVMNAGSGNVPTFTVTSSGGTPDNVATPQEILYSDYWYDIGTRGVRMRFSDAPFGNGDTIKIYCDAIQYAVATSGAAPVGSAKYVWSSRREGKSPSATTTQVTGTAVGTKGVTIAFSDSGQHTARDEFRIICSGPQPSVLGVTTLNYGSVTVSTYSPTKVVWFEILSGATVMSSTKFGLQSHGTASHHDTGNDDTYFAFGTGGEGSPGSDGTEWKSGVLGNSDLDDSTPPSYLSATEGNLSEVSTADLSETVGIANGEMVSDFVYLAVKLGASEVGANPSINYRMFFDFS